MIKSISLVLFLLALAYTLDPFKYTAVKPPLSIIAYKATKPLSVDGKLDEEDWQRVPFTPNFGDISATDSTPKLYTKAKVLYDDNNIYIGVELEEPYPVATIQHGLIWKDNSVGIYFDPASSSNLYNQYDINAWLAESSIVLVDTYKTNYNTIDPYNMNMQKGVSIKGKLNDPAVESESWTVELAFPLHFLTQLHDEGKPKEGSVWRTLISRVQWGYKEVNRTWVKDDNVSPWYSCSTPQWAVSLHHPENYNFLQFTEKNPADAKLEYPRNIFEIQQVLLWIYKAQQKYVQKNSKYATSYSDMDIFSESLRVENGADKLEVGGISLLGIYPDSYGYAASILVRPANGDPVIWSIRDDYKMWKTPYYNYVPSGPHIAYGVSVTSILLNIALIMSLVGLGVYVYFVKKRAGYGEIQN
jgi:hypothetical protein